MSLKISTTKPDIYTFIPKVKNSIVKSKDIIYDDTFLIDVNIIPPKHFEYFYTINNDKTLFCLTEITNLENNMVKCFGNMADTTFDELKFHSYHLVKFENTIPSLINADSKYIDTNKFEHKDISCSCIKVFKKKIDNNKR